MKLPWVKEPKLKEIEKVLSYNKQYVITRYEQPSVLKLYAQNSKGSLYGLAHTLYNDCISNLSISTPLRCEVVFYTRRNFVYIFEIKNYQSMEEVLKELAQQLEL